MEEKEESRIYPWIFGLSNCKLSYMNNKKAVSAIVRENAKMSVFSFDH